MLQGKYILSTLTALILLLAACTRTGMENTPTIHVNVDEDLPADSFITHCTSIRLDSVTQPMLSEPRGIRILDSLLYILDDAGRIFTFTTDGHHLATLDSMGLGEGRYATADAFDITRAGIFVLSRPQKRIMQYTLDGHYTRAIPLHDYYLDFRLQTDSSLTLASGSCNTRMHDFMTISMPSGTLIHEVMPFARTESFISDTYHPFVGLRDDTLLVTRPFRTDIFMLKDGQATPLWHYAFNTREQMPEHMDDYTYEELIQMTRHKHVVRGIALCLSTQQAQYVGYELFGKCGLSFLLARTRADGSTQNMTIMNNPEPGFPYLSAPLGTVGDCLVSIMPAYAVLQTEKTYGIDKFTSEGLRPTDNPVVFLHQLK